MVKQKLHCKNAALIETACQAYKKAPHSRDQSIPDTKWWMIAICDFADLEGNIYSYIFYMLPTVSMEPISSLQTSSDPADVCYLAVLWQAETMWMHTADNDCIVCLFHAAREPLWRAVIQSQSRDLCFSLESMPVSMGLGQNIDKVISRCLLSRCNYRVKMSIF